MKFLKVLKAFVILVMSFCVTAYAQNLDEEFTQLPDSLREKILDKDAVFSVQEARDLVNFRRSMGDTLVPKESAPDTTIIPKDSLFGTHVNPLIVGTEVLGLNAFV